MRKVFLESPYRGNNYEETENNLEYAKKCMRDCFINHGESPFASHLIFTLPGILDDKVPEEREMGMEAGWAYAKDTEASIFYIDLGMSEGMEQGLERAIKEGRPVEYRKLKKEDWFSKKISIII